MKNIITTYNKKTWKQGGNNIILGKWCLPFEKEKIINTKKIPTHHWENKTKKTNDYYYLKKLYKKILKALCLHLNKNHNSNYSYRSWALMLSPWLIGHLTSMFDKYETLKKNIVKSKKYKTQVLKYDKHDLCPVDYLDYIYNKGNKDDWHHIFFAELIKYFYKNKILISNVAHKRKETFDNSFNLKESIKIKLSSDNNLRKNNFFLDTTLLKIQTCFQLCYKTKNKPYFTSKFNAEQNKIKNKINFNLRKKLNENFKFKTNNKFENFIKDCLFDYIPSSHLENFNDYEKSAEKFKFNGKKIISRGAHISLDFYKHWCAKQIESGKKHIIAFHGADFPEKNINFDYEYQIADNLIIHSKKFRKKHIRLPVLNLSPAKRMINPKEILVVTYPESAKFGTRAGLSSTYGESVLVSFNFLIKALSKLNSDIVKILKFRTLIGSTWDFNKRITYFFGNKQIDNNNNYLSALKDKKLVILNYLGTPFYESIISNIPTICLQEKNAWVYEKKFKNILIKMERNNIIFYDIKKFTKHINTNFQTIDNWWNSKEVVSTIREYKKLVCLFEKNKNLNSWVNFLN